MGPPMLEEKKGTQDRMGYLATIFFCSKAFRFNFIEAIVILQNGQRIGRYAMHALRLGEPHLVASGGYTFSSSSGGGGAMEIATYSP